MGLFDGWGLVGKFEGITMMFHVKQFKSRICFIAICSIGLWACDGSDSKDRAIIQVGDTTVVQDTVVPEFVSAPDVGNEEYAMYYIVIADTGKLYGSLFESMNLLSKSLPLEVDLMGRSYNNKKDLIALPDNAEDEIYAGDYFPRRYPSKSLSLEYLDFYKAGAGNKTIALVSGIYETETKADSALDRLRMFEPGSFKLKSKVYIGCMH